MSNHILKVGMEIEYDEVKNDINYKKHKYELACAQDIINSITLFGSERAIFSDDYDEDGEPRSMIIAEYNGDIVLPQDPNNLLFGESATFHSCAPMSGTLTFQWHTFRGEGQNHTYAKKQIRC